MHATTGKRSCRIQYSLNSYSTSIWSLWVIWSGAIKWSIISMPMILCYKSLLLLNSAMLWTSWPCAPRLGVWMRNNRLHLNPGKIYKDTSSQCWSCEKYKGHLTMHGGSCEKATTRWDINTNVDAKNFKDNYWDETRTFLTETNGYTIRKDLWKINFIYGNSIKIIMIATMKYWNAHNRGMDCKDDSILKNDLFHQG